jgi:hypothetical protein
MKTLFVIAFLFSAQAGAMEVSDIMANRVHFAPIPPHGIKPIPPKCEPVPIPAAVWLFASALAGIGLISRRSK